MSDALEFYNDLAETYDAMTSFDARIEGERSALAPLVDEYGIRSAVDMGCGSGVHSLALAGLGVDVQGVDLSPSMLERARENALRLGLPAEFLTGDMRDAALQVRRVSDAVICLGNTLPHLRDVEDLGSTLASWHGALRPGGVLLLQCVNYDRVLETKERIVGTRLTEQGCIVRFYDFSAPRITFNVLVIAREAGGTRHRLISTELRPFLREELLFAARSAGFRSAEVFSDLNRSAWDGTGAATVLIALR